MVEMAKDMETARYATAAALESVKLKQCDNNSWPME